MVALPSSLVDPRAKGLARRGPTAAGRRGGPMLARSPLPSNRRSADWRKRPRGVGSCASRPPLALGQPSVEGIIDLPSEWMEEW